MPGFQLLIVDDERYVVESVADTLPWQTIGIETVHKAYSGEEALARMSADCVDIVITDIRMPEMSGIELVEKIRSGWKQTKCILLSGHSEFEFAKKAITLEAFDYVLKPVKDHQLLETVRRAVEAISMEREELSQYIQTSCTLKENLPSLRAGLLGELLHGKKLRSDALDRQLSVFGLPFVSGDSCCMLLIRMEDEFLAMDPQSLFLHEYAVTKMAEEIFEPDCRIWHGKDRYGHIAVLAKLADARQQQFERMGGGEEQRKELLEQLALRLQDNIRSMLKGKATIMVGSWWTFPGEIRSAYLKLLVALRKWAGGERECIIREDDSLQPESLQTGTKQLSSLYEPPTLLQLLETGRWDAARDKLQDVCKELAEHWPESLDHIAEAFFTIAGSYSCIIHRNNRQVTEILKETAESLHSPYSIRSVQQLSDWALGTLRMIESDMERESRYSRAYVVKKAQQFIERNLSRNVSLKMVADHVHMHYTHLCKIYKLETQENLSDYLYRLRMGKAAYFLKNSSDKIYEIGEKLGYQNTPYFIKVFKQHFGMTPQEYRESE